MDLVVVVVLLFSYYYYFNSLAQVIRKNLGSEKWLDHADPLWLPVTSEWNRKRPPPHAPLLPSRQILLWALPPRHMISPPPPPPPRHAPHLCYCSFKLSPVAFPGHNHFQPPKHVLILSVRIFLTKWSRPGSHTWGSRISSLVESLYRYRCWYICLCIYISNQISDRRSIALRTRR